MQIEIVLPFILVWSIFSLLCLVTVIILRFNEIMSFIFPSSYALAEIIMNDRECKTLTVRKGKKNMFKFKEIEYNLFVGDDENPLVKSPYRSGGLIKFFYRQGVKQPYDIQVVSYNASAAIQDEMLKIDFGKIINRSSSLDVLKNPIFWIVLVVLLVLLYVASKVGGNPA